jgi:hypothetical protein
MILTNAQLQDTLRRAGWPESLVPIMAAVGLAESSGNPRAVAHTSAEYSVGIWQINTYAHTQYSVNDLYDPDFNARAALEIYHTQGLHAWSTYTSGAYRKYLTGTLSAGANNALAMLNNPQTMDYLVGGGTILITLAIIKRLARR